MMSDKVNIELKEKLPHHLLVHLVNVCREICVFLVEVHMLLFGSLRFLQRLVILVKTEVIQYLQFLHQNYRMPQHDQ